MIDVTAADGVSGDAGVRSNVVRLAAAQALTGANAAVIFATGSIVGATLAPSISLATVPISMYVFGLAAGTLPTGAISRAHGRRVAFIVGTGCGVLTGLLGAFAILRGSFGLFCGATFLGGLYGAVSQSYRFAAADGASAEFRPKAVSWVMAGGVFAGVLGPQLVQWTMDVWSPYLFAFSFVAQAIVALIAMAVLAGVDAPKPAPSNLHGVRPLFEIARQPRFIAAALCGVIAYPIMNLVMTSAPLAMKMCGLSLSDSNFGIQWHIVAMYGPSFFTGSLIARFGAPRVVAAGLLLEAAGAAIGLRAGAGDASAAGTQQGSGLQRFPGVRHDGGGLVLFRPVAGEFRLVGGEPGGVSTGGAGTARAGGGFVGEAADGLATGSGIPRNRHLIGSGSRPKCWRCLMPSRARLDEFIAVVESGDHAGAIERYYTDDSSMQENTAPPRVGRDVLVAHEQAALARMSHVYSKAISSVVEGDHVAIHWIFELTDKSGKVHRVDEVALQQWRGDKIFRERFFYDPSKPKD